MKKIIQILIPALLFGIINIYAQNDDIREKIENIKLEKMTAKLSLDENTKTAFVEKYKSFSKELRELNVKRAKTYKALTERAEEGEGLDSLLNLLIGFEDEINNKRIDFVNDLKSILTSRQIAKMIIFERKFNNEIKKILKQYQKDNRKD